MQKHQLRWRINPNLHCLLYFSRLCPLVYVSCVVKDFSNDFLCSQLKKLSMFENEILMNLGVHQMLITKKNLFY